MLTITIINNTNLILNNRVFVYSNHLLRTSSCNAAFRNVRWINERHFDQLKLGAFAAKTKLKPVNHTSIVDRYVNKLHPGCVRFQIVLHCQTNDLTNLIVYMKLNAALIQENNHGISMVDAWSGPISDFRLNPLDDRYWP